MAEIFVVLALLGLLVTLLLHTLTANQKVFRNLRQRGLLAEQLRDGQLALISDIRSASVKGDTLRLLSDSAFEFFSTIGSSIVCTIPSPQVIALVPASLTSGVFLSSLPLPPDTGDLVALYSGPDSIAGIRRWTRFRISAVTTSLSSSVCPLASGYTTSSDLQRQAYRITLASVPADLRTGAPVRIIRRGRYSLYKASDGGWFLGYKRCNAVATGCSTVQPISGPYLAFSSANGGGIRFQFIDSAGAVLPSTRPLDVAGVQIVLRGEIDAAGRVTGRTIDSVLVAIAPRNLN